MAEPTSCCVVPGGYCARVDTLFNLPGVHVLDVAWREPTKGVRRGSGCWWRPTRPRRAALAVG
jgi:hypothetical protein